MVQLNIIGKHGGDKSQEVSQYQVCTSHGKCWQSNCLSCLDIKGDHSHLKFIPT